MTTESAEGADRLGAVLAAAAGGDPEASAQLYEATSSEVYGMALMVLRTATDAAEVTRQTYDQVWREADRRDPTRGSVMAWVLGIVHRLAVQRARDVAQPRAALPGRYAAGVDLHPRQRAQQAFTHLGAPDEEFFRLAFVDGYTTREVAALHACGPESVSGSITDALRRLRRHVAAPASPDSGET